MTRSDATGCPHRWGFLSLEVLSQLGENFNVSQPSLVLQLMHLFFLILKSITVLGIKDRICSVHIGFGRFLFFQYSIPFIHYVCRLLHHRPCIFRTLCRNRAFLFPLFAYTLVDTCLLLLL